MKIIHCTIIFVLLSILSITGQERISIDPERTPRGSLALSELIESIEYIPLETNGQCYLGDINYDYQVIVSDNYIIVQYFTLSSNSYFLFNRAGKFIAQIGRMGGGPGEYLNSSTLVGIDEKNNQIIIGTRRAADNITFNYYDLNGKFVQSTLVDQRFIHFRGIKLDDKYVSVRISVNNPERSFHFGFFSNDYKLIKEKKIDTDITFGGTRMYSHYTYNGQLHFKISHRNDTLYRINKDFSFFPKYFINTGRYSVFPGITEREYNNSVALWSVFETDRYILISYRYIEKLFYHYYDKNRRQSFLFNSDSGIPNDYDGGLSFWPMKQNGKEFVSWYNAYFFEENENSIRPKGTLKAVENLNNVTKGIEKFTRENLTEANPVIVIVKFK